MLRCRPISLYSKWWEFAYRSLRFRKFIMTRFVVCWNRDELFAYSAKPCISTTLDFLDVTSSFKEVLNDLLLSQSLKSRGLHLSSTIVVEPKGRVRPTSRRANALATVTGNSHNRPPLTSDFIHD